MPTRRKTTGQQNKSKRTRSKSRSPSSPKTPLTEDEFTQKLDDLAKDDFNFKEEVSDGLAEVVNESLMKHYKHFFKFSKEDEKTFNGIITKEDVKRIKEQLGDKPRKHNIENASYQWQMFLFEVMKIIKDIELSLSIDRYTWDAGLIVLYAAYPDYLNHKNEEGQKDVMSGYVGYKHLTTLFQK
jgi:hypothetical protein